MKKILVNPRKPDPRQDTRINRAYAFHAQLETDSRCHGHGSSPIEAVGNLARCNSYDLGLQDEDLHVQYGVLWEDMSDFEIGCVVKARDLLKIKVQDTMLAN